eukprot:gi/632988742/ref/XP_007883277.1/ PREDICTED: tachykinin-3 [Callorhinchus milii]
MMRILFALAVLSIFLKTSHGNWEESVQQPGNGWDLDRGNRDPGNVPSFPFKRYYDGLSYDGFVGLMGRRMAGTKASAQKRNMHDFFVGLMGRRNVEYGESTPPGRAASAMGVTGRPRSLRSV